MSATSLSKFFKLNSPLDGVDLWWVPNYRGESLEVVRHILVKSYSHSEQVQFERNCLGKPRAIKSELNFNLAHCDSHIMLAFSKKQVGVDFEKIKVLPNAISLAKRFFLASEYEFIKNSQMPSFDFLKIWTQKEAMVKARGESIIDGLGKYATDSKQSDTVKTFIHKESYLASICLLSNTKF